ncbi:MAG TPA: hypothetical protein VHU80_12225, partial [Polyangiaceae bacterium]|nr:hypothetical protein [Polyangiaceae bacterium]
PASVDEDEELFALALGALVVPPALADGSVVCRMPLPEERDTPGDFRYAYQSAIRSYAAVGFQRVGDFSLVLFE